MKHRCSANPQFKITTYGAANTCSLGDGDNFSGGSYSAMLPRIDTENIRSTMIGKMPGILQGKYAFIRHDRRNGISAKFCKCNRVACWNRLLCKKEFYICKFAQAIACLLNSPTTIGIDGNWDIWPTYLTNCPNSCDIGFRIKPHFHFNAINTKLQMLLRHDSRTSHIAGPNH